MKEGLEKHFEGGVQTPEELPVVEQEIANPGETQEQQVEAPVVEEQQQTEEVVEEQPVQELEPLIEIQEEVVIEEKEEKPSILPENVDKLVDFLNDNPGATLQDYVNLNKSYDESDNATILSEYYKQSKPHLDKEDIDYLLNKKLNINEDELDEIEVRERKIALKEEISKAKNHLQTAKDKYYTELKANVGNVATNEKEIAIRDAQSKHFQEETNKVFEGFKGFTFDLNDGKKVRYNVENSEKLKSYQSDPQNVFSDYMSEDGLINDAAGYHKALFAAKNADKIAKLFYEQGKADAVKAATQDSKNIDFSHQHRAPESSTKLKPGQARELTPDTSSGPKINLKYTKF